jgi:hypothetical protein
MRPPTKVLISLATILAAVNGCHAASNHEMHVGAQVEQFCSESIILAIGKSLRIEGFRMPLCGNHANDEAIIASAACKAGPAFKPMTAAAVAYASNREDTKALVLALIDGTNGVIVASYKGEISADAGMRVESGSLWIDTAPYQLAAGVRAIGLDVTSGYIPNCGDGGSGAARTLYVQEGRRLRPVLENLTMSSWRFLQQGKSRCVGETDAPATSIIETFALSIALANTSTNGYRDLQITATGTRNDSNKATRRPFHFKLKYDGRKYDPQEMETSFWKWRSDP